MTDWCCEDCGGMSKRCKQACAILYDAFSLALSWGHVGSWLHPNMPVAMADLRQVRSPQSPQAAPQQVEQAFPNPTTSQHRTI